MKHTFGQRFFKTVRWFTILFIAMFLFRLMYGYLPADISKNNDYSENFFSSVENLRRNYASEKFLKANVTGQSDFASSQKYEKTATIKSKTSQFDEDVAAIKSATKNYEGVIQYEKNTGNTGSREIHLLIGINPEKFDSFYLKTQHIGVIKSTSVTKIDKTNEYRKLNAKKASLEKTLSSLNELKSRSGQISDYVSLHDKILEIETQLQELGVELGNFDTENEFCTIKFSLYEGAAEKSPNFLRRIKIAIEWTIKYYAIVVLSILAVTVVVFLLLLIVDRLKIIKTVTGKMDE